MCRLRLKDAKEEFKKHPAYGTAATVQRLEAELKALIMARRDSIKLAYDFQENLLDTVELKLLGLL